MLSAQPLSATGDRPRPPQAAVRSSAERVADVGFRLATAGLAHCPRPAQTLGLTFQHLGQYEPKDRPGVARALHLDLGPAVLAVARDGPADRAGIRRDDVLLAIGDAALPAQEQTGRPFDQAAARARLDDIDDRLVAAGSPARLQVLRGDHRLSFTVVPVAACPSRIHLARSNQRNAFADGTHLTVTTGLLDTLTSDDELAFVLAHEMAHNILQHAALLRARGVPRGMTRVFGKNGDVLRATERAADLLGGRLVLDAQYDLSAAAVVLKSLDEGFGISFLSAHDATGKRIAALRALAAQNGGAPDRPTRE